MKDCLQLALVGCGGIARAHLAGYRNLHQAGYDKFTLAALCDPDAGRLRSMAAEVEAGFGYRPALYGSVEEMLSAASVQAADICTPHALHHQNAVPCLRQGVHVMVEKPCGITVKASRRILDAAAKSGALVATAEQVRRCRGSRVIEWAINRAKLMGQPRFFTMEVFGASQYDRKAYAWAWRGLKLLGGGGALIDGGAHYADMMLHVFGPVAKVYCQMRTFETPLLNGPAGLGKQPLDVEDTWLATLHFESGLVGHWSWSRQAWGHKVTSGVYWGSKGSFQDRQQWMHAFQFGADLCLKDGTEIAYEELEKRYFAKLSQKQRDQLFPFGFDDGITNECWDFVEACTRGRAPEVDGEAGLQAKSLCYAFYESSLAGKPVRPADVASGKVNAYQKPIDAYWRI